MKYNSKYINSQYYNKYSKYLKNYKTNKNQESNISEINKNNNYDNISAKQEKIKSNENNKRNQNNPQFSFDHIRILGIDLFSDDILLVLLIYFLYTQGIKDIYLFIVLILLLLS